MRGRLDFRPQLRAALPTVDDDIIEELAEHASAVYGGALAEGCPTDEAQRRVDAQVAAWTASARTLGRRPKRQPAIPSPPVTASFIGALWQDVRYAWRVARRQPGYTAVLVATMAIGIAATTVLGSVAYGVLLKPLPWANAPRLVRLYETRHGSTTIMPPLMSNATFREWWRGAKTLDGLGAWSTSQMALAGDRPERVRAAAVTPGLLTLLDAVPLKGRLFADGDEEPSRPPVLLLSYRFWQQRFGGREDVIGQTLRLDGRTYTIVGVMPPTFAFPAETTRVWTPLYVPPLYSPGRQGPWVMMFQAIGRLRPGATPAQAAAEGTARGRNAPPDDEVAMAMYGSNGPVEVTALPLLDALTKDVKPAILILLAAAALLLVAATANAAGIQLARATARRRELAIRAAIGAGTGRLVRQTLVENLVMGVLGGAAGLVLAALLHRALPFVLPADFPRAANIAFDVRVQLFGVAVSLAVGVGCGLLPAWQAARANVLAGLVEDALAPTRGGLRSRTARARAAIITAQVAIASMLVVTSVLLGRSFLDMLHADVGYDADNVLAATMILPSGDFTPQRRAQTAADVIARLRSVPGVTRAAYTTATPFSNVITLSSFTLRARDGSLRHVQTGVRSVSPGYFAALGQRVVEGREFADTDAGAVTTVVMVNREFSRRYLDGRALGWMIPDDDAPANGKPVERRVIGVVADTVRRSVMDAPEPEVFLLAVDQALTNDQIAVVVRTGGDPRSLVAAVRAAAQDAAPTAILESVMTMDDKAAATLTRPRLYAALSTAFAVFALTIAAVGLFGILSYTVALRAREIAVRSALGARVSDIVGLVLRQSMAIALTGISIGLLASFWAAGAFRGLLYGVSAHDLSTVVGVAGLLVVVTAVASVVPARRAASLDPASVLRG
ncbi:MAG: ADOP family duplicated permease [Betaproteobacteria bacterium]